MRGAWCLLFLVSTSSAQASKAVVVSADGCPTSAAVVQALAPLLPDWQIRRDPDPLQDSVELSVHDEGSSYRVAGRDVDKRIEDPLRRCDDRARTSAVVIQLALAPPALAAPTAPGVRRTSTPYVDLGASGAFDAAPNLSSGGALFTGGGQLHLHVGHSWVGGVLGIGGAAPSHPRFGGYTYSLTRVPLDLGVYLAWRRRAFELGGEVGIVLGPLLIDGVDLASTLSSVRLEAALRIRPEVRYWVRTWLAVSLTFACDISVRTYQLEVNPVGKIGETPRLWTELALGVVFRLKNPEKF